MSPIANRVRVSGLVNNAKRFEFAQGSETVAQLMQLAKPQAQATMCVLLAIPEP